MAINIDSDGGYISLGDYSIVWGNSVDPSHPVQWVNLPHFVDERLEGFLSINAGAISLEFGCIDQGRPGVYITKYEDGEVESTTALLQF